MRKLYHDKVLAGFAGATADAFTLFERFEAKLEKHQGHLVRAAIELTKDWRTDRVLRRLEAMLAVADREASLIITGNGDVLEPEHGIIAIGSAARYAQAAAKALLDNTELGARDIVKKSLEIAGELCIYTNMNHTIEVAGAEPSMSMTPQEIVSELDRHIVGQARGQARRGHRAAQPLAPPAGRREAAPRDHAQEHPDDRPHRRRQDRDRAPPGRLADAPFIKVEATKFTEVGYVGKDVDSIMRDLAEIAVKQTRVAEMRKVRTRAEDAAEERILDVLLPLRAATTAADSTARQVLPQEAARGRSWTTRTSRSTWPRRKPQLEIMGPAGMEEMTEQLRGMFSQFGGQRRKTRKLKIAEAMKLLVDEEAGKLVNEDEITRRRPSTTPSRTASSSSTRSTRSPRAARPRAPTCRARACSATCCRWWRARRCRTKYGAVRTDHILFIASGAFHLSKPSDLIPELQGRLPIRVELQSLSVQDFEAILTSTHASLVKQYQALLATEGVHAGVHARRHHAAGAASPSR